MENIIVIGGGLMGSAVAWQLSNIGQKVLLLEQQNEKYQSGSSFGMARISRSLGPKRDVFSFVQQRTVEETQKLLNYLNGFEPSKPHRMSQIYRTSPVTYLFNKNQKGELDELLFKKQKDKYKEAKGDEAFRKFGVDLPKGYTIVREYKKYSGTLNPHILIKKMQLGIERKGNKIQFNRKVVRLTKTSNGYEVKVKNLKTGKSKIIRAKKIITAAGPYTPELLENVAPYFKKLIMPKKVDLAFFKINKKRYEQLSKLQKKNLLNAHPVFDQNKTQFFSMVEKVEKDGSPIFKAGEHLKRGNILELDRTWCEKPRKKDIKSIKKLFKKYLEMLTIYVSKKDIEVIDSYSCVYSMSKTKIPFVTNTIDKNGRIEPNLVVIGGMSGVGAKGCLGYGLLASDLLLGTSESDRIYQIAKRKFGNPEVRLRTKKRKRNKKFLWLDSSSEV